VQTLPISANDGVSEKLPPAARTVKGFLEWLESLPADTTFCDGPRTQDCPVAKFLGRNAAYGDESLPAWAVTFMTRYDNETSTSLQDALTVAKALQDEILPS
jgi:hypothetical protein